MSRRSLQRHTWQSDECHAQSARVTVRQLQTPVLPSCSGQVALPWLMQALRGSCAGGGGGGGARGVGSGRAGGFVLFLQELPMQASPCPSSLRNMDGPTTSAPS